MQFKNALSAALLLAGTSSLAASEDGSWIKQSVFGMDCAPCAYAMERSLGQLSGVERVEVELNHGLATIYLSREAEPDIDEIREVSRRNGFTPKAAEIRLAGEIIKDKGTYSLQVGAQRFELALGEKLSGRSLEQLAGDRVTVTGHIPEGNTNRLVADVLEREE